MVNREVIIMTVEEFYKWAVKHDCEGMEITVKCYDEMVKKMNAGSLTTGVSKNVKARKWLLI